MMSTRTYIAAVAEEPGGFSVFFPDVPGCTSCGSTLEEALAMGKDALEGHLESLRENGDQAAEPAVHELADVIAQFGDLEDGRWLGLFPISVDLQAARGDVDVALPRELIHDVDELGSDVRRFITDATRRELERLRKSA
jgi:predicted RNase H-like HicB family nuclease